MIDDYSKIRLTSALKELRDARSKTSELIESHDFGYALGYLEGIVSGVLFELEGVLRYADDDEAEES